MPFAVCFRRLVSVAGVAALPAFAAEPDFSAYAKTYPWVVAPDAIAAAAERHPLDNFVEADVPPWELPPLLRSATGAAITAPAAWTRRRAELLELFRREMFGIAPPRPADLTFTTVESDPRAMDGAATFKRIAIGFALGGERFAFHLKLFVPNRRPGPAPVFLQLNHRGVENTDPTRATRTEFWPAEYVVARGFAVAAVDVAAEVDPDRPAATTGVRAFYRKHSPQGADYTWATLAAWAWSGSRALDYLETDREVDARRVAVLGHSRTGKTALWAAASDERFALACVNGAGEGGPALARRNFGETLGRITRNFPHWFTSRYAGYADRIHELPADAHQLIALVAPRGYHGGDATRDLWADPRGSWLALVAASEVWTLLGHGAPLNDPMPPVNGLLTRGPLAYHLREGRHDLNTFDWKLYLDHAEKLFGQMRPR